MSAKYFLSLQLTGNKANAMKLLKYVYYDEHDTLTGQRSRGTINDYGVIGLLGISTNSYLFCQKQINTLASVYKVFNFKL